MASDQEDKRGEHLKRDRPLFTSRRHHSPSHQPPDFLTESLNTSQAPSPSLNRESARDGRRAKSRRVLGTPRGLAASFKATADSRDDHFPFSSASSSEGRQTIPTYTSRLSHDGTSKPSQKTAGRFPRRGTPSPSRDQKVSIASPSSSASSPPHELAESYQRINDEESLAQEDSVEDDMGTYTYDTTHLERSPEDERTDLKYVQGLDSSTPLNPPRNGSPRRHEEVFAPDERDIEDNQQVAGEETGNSNQEYTTKGSPTGQSSQYTKDLQRVHGVLNTGARAFRKGRLGGRVGLTVENLSRRNGSNESLGNPLEGESVSSKGSNPSSNIPREWGRKARPGNDWLNRINSKSGRYTGDISKRQRGKPAIPENRDIEPLHEWVNTAPEVSNLPPDHRSTSSAASTPTASMQNTSLERVADWEINDDDFTGRSMQISDSPPIRVRTNTLERDVDREIDNVAKKAVTTNRLDELRERTPDERLRQGLQTRSAENLSLQRTEKTHQTPQHRRSSLKFQLGPETVGKSEQFGASMAALGDEGDPIPDSPVVIYRSTPDISNKATKEEGSSVGNRRNSSRRHSHGQHDSRDLLRQLARATGESPTSTKDEEPVGNSINVNPKIAAQPDENPSKDDHKATDLPETTENKNKDGSKSRAPKREEKDPVVQKTPQPSRSKLDMKTPLVTGAWIDTPLPSGSHGPPLPTPANLDNDKDINAQLGGESRKVAATDLIRTLNPNILSRRPKLQSQEPFEDTGPLVPKSALESIISAAKSQSKSSSRKKVNILNADSDEDPTLLLGESTIQSLEEILEDNNYTSKSFPFSQQFPELQSDDDHSIDEDPTESQKSSLSTVQSQISRLDNVGPSIRDAKRRLAFLERVVSKSKRRSSYQEQCDEGGEIHDFVWPCEKCGYVAQRDRTFASTATEGLATISITIPKLWRWREDDWRPRLTWLGVGVLVWWGYLIADRVAW